MTTSYKFRLTLKNTTLPKVLPALPLSLPHLYCSEGEGTENPHYHFFFQTDLTGHAIRARLKALGLAGNTDYSMKKLTEQYPIEYLAYVTKLGHYTSTLPKDILANAIAHDQKVKEEMKDKKKKKQTTVQRVEEGYLIWFEEHIPDRDLRGDKPDPWKNPQALMKFIVDTHIEEGKTIAQYHVQRIFDTLMIKHSTRFRQNFEEFVMHRYDPRN